MWEELIAHTLTEVEFITIGVDTIIAWNDINEVIHTWNKSEDNIEILTKLSKVMNFNVYI